jgi:hypothetical protein
MAVFYARFSIVRLVSMAQYVRTVSRVTTSTHQFCVCFVYMKRNPYVFLAANFQTVQAARLLNRPVLRAKPISTTITQTVIFLINDSKQIVLLLHNL